MQVKRKSAQNNYIGLRGFDVKQFFCPLPSPPLPYPPPYIFPEMIKMLTKVNKRDKIIAMHRAVI